MMIKTFASKQCSTESAAMFAEVCIEYWETIAFLCPREIVRESENALHLRADSGSTFAELRVLDRSYPHRGEDLTFEKSRNSDVQWIRHCASCFQEPR